MIDYTNRKITQLASETGMPKDVIMKALCAADRMQTIFSSPFGSMFAVQGGTAKNMLYPDGRRLYTEMDLCYIGDGQKIECSKNTGDKTRDIREYIGVVLHRICMQEGIFFRKTLSRENYADCYMCLHWNHEHVPYYFVLRIDYRSRHNNSDVVQRKACLLGSEGDVPFNTFSAKELDKDIADSFFHRCRPVDVYDLYGLMKEHDMMSPEGLRQIYEQAENNCYTQEDAVHIKTKLYALTERDFRYYLDPILPSNDGFVWREAVQEINSVL